MPRERVTRHRLIEQTVSRRTGVGPNELVRGWQSLLSGLLDGLGAYLRPAGIVTFRHLTPAEDLLFRHIAERIHVSANACGIYLPPSVRNQMFYTNRGMEIPESESAPKDDGVLLFTRPSSRTTIINGLLARSPCTPAVDVYNHGALLAGYVYNTIDECLASMADVIRTYLGDSDVRA